MIKKSTRLMLAATAALMMSGSAFAACVRPADPEIPAGDSASGADMLKAKKAVETYIAEIEAYLKCGVDSRTEKLALEDMEKVADRFNEELRTYKAKS